MVSVPLLTLVLALQAAPSVAVVDLSPKKADALAEAFRKTPGVKGRALAGAATATIVSDAESLGMICTVTDEACLDKLLVLLKTKELLAFSMKGTSVSVVYVVNGSYRRAKVKFVGPASTARTAWQELEQLKPKDEKPPPDDGGGGPGPLEKPIEPLAGDKTGPGDGDDDVRERIRERNLDTGGGDVGVSPALAVGVIGGGLALGCGAGALGVSVDLAQRLQNAGPGAPLDGDAYRGRELAFNALGICAIAGVVGAGAGIAWMFVAPPGEPAAPPGPGKLDLDEDGDAPSSTSAAKSRDATAPSL